MRLDIRYRTVFEYDTVVRDSQNELRACPATDDRQQLLAYRVTTSPSARTLSFTDYWGTRVDHFGIREPHVLLEVVAEAAVETGPAPPVTAMATHASLADPEFRDLHGEFLERSRHTDWGERVEGDAARLVEMNAPDLHRVVKAINRHVGACLQYTPGATEIGVGVEELLESGEGVCQDYAHLAVALCRSVGVPARYVSGYLFTKDDATGEMADSFVRVQTHAWFEAAIPGHGWFALDPTNQLDVGQQHVKIGHGRDYDDVAPLRGTYSGGGQPSVDAAVEIRRMDPTRQPATLVQPSVPRALEARLVRERQQQQQQ